jgi:hypothetical protein
LQENKEYISGYLKGGYRKEWFMRMRHMSFMLHVEFREMPLRGK